MATREARVLPKPKTPFPCARFWAKFIPGRISLFKHVAQASSPASSGGVSPPVTEENVGSTTPAERARPRAQHCAQGCCARPNPTSPGFRPLLRPGTGALRGSPSRGFGCQGRRTETVRELAGEDACATRMGSVFKK